MSLHIICICTVRVHFSYELRWSCWCCTYEWGYLFCLRVRCTSKTEYQARLNSFLLYQVPFPLDFTFCFREEKNNPRKKRSIPCTRKSLSFLIQVSPSQAVSSTGTIYCDRNGRMKKWGSAKEGKKRHNMVWLRSSSYRLFDSHSFTQVLLLLRCLPALSSFWNLRLYICLLWLCFYVGTDYFAGFSRVYRKQNYYIFKSKATSF